MEYKITEELANQVMSYLAQQPFFQVNKLLSELSNLQPITDIKSTKGAKPSKIDPGSMITKQIHRS